MRGLPVAVLVSLLVTFGCTDDHNSGGAHVAAQHVLDAYVTADGRVLRHDQGDDVVSEGQAYGMLIADLAGRNEVTERIWQWTAEHLQRPDGLLSAHADSTGTVLDRDSAADADVLAAFALLRSDRPSLRAAGTSLAEAVLEHEVDWNVAPVLVAGSWARSPQTVVNPSYLMPDIFEQLAAQTRDDRWQRLSETAVDLVAEATQQGRSLPTDWAQLERAGLVSTPAPDASQPLQYGLDAQRVPLWFANSCSDDAQSLAARWWSLLDRGSSALALRPDGSVIDATIHPVPLLAAASAARAAGEDERAQELVRRASNQARSAPTYYGDAWLALEQGLENGDLFRC